MLKSKLKNRKGFTVVEMIVVIVILSILTSVAVPTTIKLIDIGKQTSRTNIARTLYLTAQEQLSQKKLSKTLRLFSGAFYDAGTDDLNEASRVYYSGVTAASIGEMANNKEFVRYIKKDKTTTLNMADPVVALFNDIILNKSILNNAICVEYNVKTGVVLSVFYSETLNSFVYGGATDPLQDISGERPYNNLAITRKQGYYGANGTGENDRIAPKDLISLHDGSQTPLKDGGKTYTNILYAEILVANTAQDYNLQLFAKDNAALTAEINVNFPDISVTPTNLANRKDFITPGSPFLYFAGAPQAPVIQDGKDITDQYNRYIWVLDYVNDDMQDVKNKNHSIGVNFKNPTTNLDLAPQDILAGIKRDGTAEYTRFSHAVHSHYASESTGANKFYTLKSARHLNNVRYQPTAVYRQAQTITLKAADNIITNFEPIKNFGGEYLVTKEDVFIDGLTINTTALATPIVNVGLFENVISGGKLNGVSLINATVTAENKGNVGAIAGKLEAGATMQRCRGLSNVNAIATTLASDNINVGGLIGLIEARATLETSYNGGFFDTLATGATASDKGFGSVQVSGSFAIGKTVNVGGIAGANFGSIKNVYNNARVNIKDVNLGTKTPDNKLSILKTPQATSFTDIQAQNLFLGGIVGTNEIGATINFTYATNYVARYIDAKSGGIAGRQNTMAVNSVLNSFYISNGSTDNQYILKNELMNSAFPVAGSAFTKSANTYAQGQNKAENYAYPVLNQAKHRTGYEDIKETIAITTALGYFELYSDKTIGYSTTDTIAPEKSDKIVVAEGYYIDYETPATARTKVEIKLGDRKLDMSTFKWDDNSKTPNSRPITYIGNDTKKYTRVFLNNDFAQEQSKISRLNGGTGILEVQLLIDSKNFLLDKDGKFAYANMLYANAIFIDTKLPSITAYEIRSPRHIANAGVKVAEDVTLNQRLNIDFNLYRSEIKTVQNANPMYFVADDDAKTYVNLSDSAVQGEFSGTYNGGGYYIRNVMVNTGSINFNSVGLFAQVKGTVKNVALVDSSFVSNATNIGGIAGESSGIITQCQASYVTIQATAAANKQQSAGAIVGTNKRYGTLSNLYVNNAVEDADGLFTAPITASNANASKYLGGIVGNQQGNINNSYSIALAPTYQKTARNSYPRPIVGTGAVGEKVYYLTSVGFNSKADVNKDTGNDNGNRNATAITFEDTDAWKAEKMFSDPSIWQEATVDTTILTELQKGAPYPFPAIANMNHCKDWPLLITTLRYYEQYSDGTFGYYYHTLLGVPAVDSLRTDAGVYVTQEGYLIGLVSGGNFTINFDGVKIPNAQALVTTLDGKRVIQISNDWLEKNYKVGNFSTGVNNGAKPAKITVVANGVAGDILHGSETDVFINPYFAKQIQLLDNTNGAVTPTEVKDFEIRSPRQMKNITDGTKIKGNSAYLNKPAIKFKQTIDINFGGYTSPAFDSSIIKQNYIVENLNTNYDAAIKGAVVNDKTGRLPSYKISNLTLQIISVNDYKQNAAGTFGNITNNGSVTNLEFVNPQFQYNYNGAGGGIVSNISEGKIDNVNVYNTTTRALFSGINGNINQPYCLDSSIPSYTQGASSYYSHVHGGIVGLTQGATAVVSNCTVGTNSLDVKDIFNNKTQISCYADNKRSSADGDPEYLFILMGGIAGGVSGNSEIVACTNMASVIPQTSVTPRGGSTHCIGGIVGRVGSSISSAGTQPQVTPESGSVIGSYNAGTVKISFGFVGGIAGRTGGARIGSKIISCYNTGRINIEYNEKGELVEIKGNTQSLRIGGIAGEVGVTDFLNCYNIGYVSGLYTTEGSGAADSSGGAIFGLPSPVLGVYNTKIENCYSLAANQYRPATIVGPKLKDAATVNGMDDAAALKAFGAFWESRAALRTNTNLISSTYQQEPYPGLSNGWPAGAEKGYPVFSPISDTSFYLYPSLISFDYKGENYKNPHITPWEYIDAKYDATLKYYERYDDATQSYAFSFTDLRGNLQSNLKDDLKVIEDGYYIEVGFDPEYKVVINGAEFIAQPVAQDFGVDDKFSIRFTPDMLAKLVDGYNKISVYTVLDEKDAKFGAQNKEDNKLNRIVGTSTIIGVAGGNDLYFDNRFPKEMRIARHDADTANLKPINEGYEIRSARQLANITKVANTGRTFTQKNNIDFKTYTGAISNFDATTKTFSTSVVAGNFNGIYDGGLKTIANLNINSTNADVGLFETNNGTIKNVVLTDSIIESTNVNANAIGIVAANNNKSIETIAVYQPTINVNTATTSVGVVAGASTAAATFADINIVSNSATSPIVMASGGTVTNVGGLSGALAQEASVKRVIYLAHAPSDNIIAQTLTDNRSIDGVYYLKGAYMNEGVAAKIKDVIGITGQATKAFAEYPTIVTIDWPLWNRIDDLAIYPYPVLKTVANPTAFLTKETLTMHDSISITAATGIAPVDAIITDGKLYYSVLDDVTGMKATFNLYSDTKATSLWLVVDSTTVDALGTETTIPLFSQALTGEQLMAFTGNNGVQLEIPLPEVTKIPDPPPDTDPEEVISNYTLTFKFYDSDPASTIDAKPVMRTTLEAEQALEKAPVPPAPVPPAPVPPAPPKNIISNTPIEEASDATDDSTTNDSTSDEATIPKDDVVPPESNAVPPANNVVPPESNAVPPANNVVPPLDTVTPPKNELDGLLSEQNSDKNLPKDIDIGDSEVNTDEK